MHKSNLYRSRPLSLADQVHGYLRSSILNGDIQQGEKIVEMDVASRMGTSQGPVREALQRLAQEGLVERHVRSATYVITLALDEMHDLFVIRSVIEGRAIRRTVKCITPEQITILESLMQAMIYAGRRDDMLALVASDLDFHRYICEWSGSPGLLRAWMPLYSQIQLFVAHTHRDYFESLEELANTHRVIIDAIRSGKPDQAEQTIKAHVMLIWEQMKLDPD